ncbi:SIR2 family NAD-dependent protein deacylase [Coralloluteibacterium stylophorae]|uniref:NAD-dependent protein deacylase n=2 Tax=Coralloluteibacterium stylophorae TaxID=1776034 RepID=A0AAP2C9H1_9GAMM|nr:NAD-dependent deacylase [Coralloluteibacterium stylophorae]MBS7456289.1 NAD-dependent deacylase [Coralloluteibacterium stylophorae]
MRIGVLTGAGMSAESGVPTFRDALTGLWARHDPAELATEAAFRRDPALVWGWYRWRAAQVRRALPHRGHTGLAALAATHEVRVVTQNVDDLHERAGSIDVVHLHGSLFSSRCSDCGRRAVPEPLAAALADADEAARLPPPACSHCPGTIRPGVVWFGEALPTAAWDAALDVVATAELLVVVGTSGLVHPAAALPSLARRAGLPVIEINPQPGAIAEVASESWRCTAGAGIARLLERLDAGG